MQTSPLSSRHCVPYEEDVLPLGPEQYDSLLSQISGWDVVGGEKLVWDRTFENFSEAMLFVNRVASVSEEERHHPDIFLHDYRHVRISLSTHAVNGLSENDFIMAAKINELD